MQRIKSRIGEQVYTPLGKGMVVHQLKNGSYVVEFSHGNGEIFTHRELFGGSFAIGDTLCLDPFSVGEGSTPLAV